MVLTQATLNQMRTRPPRVFQQSALLTGTIMHMVSDAITATPNDVKSEYVLQLLNHFETLEEYNEFVKRSNAFHNRYVHISHDDSIAFGATKKYAKVLHRDYFTPLYENMKELTRKSQEKRDESIFGCVEKGVLKKSTLPKAVLKCLGKVTKTRIETENAIFEKLVAVRFDDPNEKREDKEIYQSSPLENIF